MKTGHYADVILEVCCGRQKLENRWYSHRTRCWLKPCTVRVAIYCIFLCGLENTALMEGTSTAMRILKFKCFVGQRFAPRLTVNMWTISTLGTVVSNGWGGYCAI
jgi:hypothetical protein